MSEFRVCAVIPTYDNPDTVRAVVERVRVFVPDVIVVDDGSHAPGREAVRALGDAGLAQVHRRLRNGGKGAAVKDGLQLAHEAGFTHALQVDADGQHCIEDAPLLLAAARDNPRAVVLAKPVFDASVPLVRLRGRAITTHLVALETLGREIADPMCGFRIYPVEEARAAGARGDAMDFDPEVAVRLVWNGTPVVNVPTPVKYISREAGGVSHFRMVDDNVLLTWMHVRLLAGTVIRTASRLRNGGAR